MRMSNIDPEFDDRKYSHLLTLLSVSAAMVGVCLTAVGLVSVIEALNKVQTWVDDLLAVGHQLDDPDEVDAVAERIQRFAEQLPVPAGRTASAASAVLRPAGDPAVGVRGQITPGGPVARDWT
jgi:hypothetical protein